MTATSVSPPAVGRLGVPGLQDDAPPLNEDTAGTAIHTASRNRRIVPGQPSLHRPPCPPHRFIPDAVVTPSPNENGRFVS
jgi:hypothetical protein